MSGKVAPSSTDCGRIKAAASDHLKACTAPGLPSVGMTRSNAMAVRARNTSWKKSEVTPIAASISAYARSRSRSRGDSRLAAQAPTAMPPMKIASTRVCA